MKIALEKNINVKEKTKNFLQTLTEIPASINVAGEVQFMLKNPKVSVSKLAKKIQRDHGLLLKILKAANSSEEGLPKRVYTIEHALVLLGINKIENLVSEIIHNRSKNIYDEDEWYRNIFWRHSMVTANTAKVIAEELNYGKPEHAFIAGLLHDFGLLVIKNFFGGVYNEITTLVRYENVSFIKAEEFTLGMNHAVIGKQILNSWQLPAELVDAVGFHFKPSIANEGRQLASIVHFADLTINSLGMSDNEWDKNFEPDKNVFTILNIHKDEVDVNSHFAFRDVLRNAFAVRGAGE